MAQHDVTRMTELGSMVEENRFLERHVDVENWKFLIEDLSITA